MAAEIAEDQALIEPGTAWIRQLWAPMIMRLPPGGLNIHPAQLQVGVSGSAILNMPIDFTTLNHLYFIVYPFAAANITMNVTIMFGQNGELYNVHTQTQAVVIAMLANRFTSVDLVTMFGALLANLAAGDHMWVSVADACATTFYAYGLDARYS